jgi:hypothetical protein
VHPNQPVGCDGIRFPSGPDYRVRAFWVRRRRRKGRDGPTRLLGEGTWEARSQRMTRRAEMSRLIVVVGGPVGRRAAVLSSDAIHRMTRITADDPTLEAWHPVPALRHGTLSVSLAERKRGLGGFRCFMNFNPPLPSLGGSVMIRRGLVLHVVSLCSGERGSFDSPALS